MATNKPKRKVKRKILESKEPVYLEQKIQESVKPYEEVVNPQHYTNLPNGIECWDVTEHFPTSIGSAIKYLWRAGKKPGQDAVKDLKKAIEYTQRHIKLLEGKTPKMEK